jgi:hypothetical protein
LTRVLEFFLSVEKVDGQAVCRTILESTTIHADGPGPDLPLGISGFPGIKGQQEVMAGTVEGAEEEMPAPHHHSGKDDRCPILGDVGCYPVQTPGEHFFALTVLEGYRDMLPFFDSSGGCFKSDHDVPARVWMNFYVKSSFYQKPT